MKTINRRLTLFLIVVFGLICTDLFSCDCAYIGFGNKVTNLDFEIENSEIIVKAKIIEKLDSVYPAYYKIEIENTWKGETEKLSLLTTGTGGGDCGMLFDIGEEYIIYGDLKDNSIYTNRCSRTKRVDKTGDYDYLNYLFHKTDYDTVNLTKNEKKYLETNFEDLTELLDIPHTLIFYKDRFITKKELLGINPNILKVYGYYFTAGEQKRLTSESLINSIHGVLIVDNALVDSEINRKKMFKRITKSTAGNNVYTK